VQETDQGGHRATRVATLILALFPCPEAPDRAFAAMPGYQTKQEQIAIAGVADMVIRSLLDREQFADPRGEAERLGISSAAWPLFGLLWPSAMQLAAQLALRPVLQGERILELGCGLALASLVGHRRGADVTASDRHPLAPSFLRENLLLNALLPMKYGHADWEQPEPAPGAPGTGDVDPVRGRFELIIASDVLYERDVNGALAGFIDRHAAAPGEVWIVDPDRGNRPAFNRFMAAAGFDLIELRLDAVATPRAPAYKGRLLSYRRGAVKSSTVLPGTAGPVLICAA
jgi:predicted nicotinamide N-methyase